MDADARTPHEQSIGGKRSIPLHEAEREAWGTVEPAKIRSAVTKLGLEANHLQDIQLEDMRRKILEVVDPPGKPAKDGKEALKRLIPESGIVRGRGASWLDAMDPKDKQTTDRVWEGVQELRAPAKAKDFGSKLQEKIGDWGTVSPGYGKGYYTIKPKQYRSKDPLDQEEEQLEVSAHSNGDKSWWYVGTNDPEGRDALGLENGFDVEDEYYESKKYDSEDAALKAALDALIAMAPVSSGPSMKWVHERGRAAKAHNQRLHNGGY